MVAAPTREELRADHVWRMSLNVVIPKEITPGENRVAATPDVVGRMVKSGNQVFVQQGAGLAAAFVDEQYSNAGATLVDGAAALFAKAGLVIKVQRPQDDEVSLFPAAAR